uniref:Endonuclease/exonuclease/phosphatase domain-containing protein n=1 Tax=Chromera velia CCMP2878 TaxID=1169474 RepID=A0A0G4HND0_9ALVE|eukprot:Cvel_29421.t1-p1 / transcript=Cvel_29421.t1 / gene=Cvel_29421 / organism=Chromera_velia_CCMP2878 / gene_product=Craniofacial development protein 2, putative / transcript_product=Craniofacial development protein 2, putative / location=Cvel_scaffold4018:605-2434(+) / protein_length=610 / sequence_SO=supercontig / SO=protein_coding / is_pseudo=false
MDWDTFRVFPVTGRGFGSNRFVSEKKQGRNVKVLGQNAEQAPAKACFPPPVRRSRAPLGRRAPLHPGQKERHRRNGNRSTHRQKQRKKKKGYSSNSQRRKGCHRKKQQSWFVGTQNCRTLLDRERRGPLAPPKRTAHVVEEFHRAEVDVAFLQETRTHGETEECKTQRLLLASPEKGGPLQRRNGIGFAFSRKAEREKPSVLQRFGKASRVVRTDLQNVTLISAYSSTSGADDAEALEFYADLREAIKNISKGNLVMVGGDFNARVGTNNEETAAVLGRHTEGQRYANRNGQLLLEFCTEHKLVIANSFFPHAAHHKQSWQHPRSQRWYELDLFLVCRRDLGRVQDVRVHRLVDCWSDYRFVGMKIIHLPRRRRQPSQKSCPGDKRKRILPVAGFAGAVHAAIEKLPVATAESRAEDLWEETATAIRSTAEALAPKSIGAPPPEWFADSCSELLPLFERKKRVRVVWEDASRKAETADGKREAEKKRHEYVRARSTAATGVRRAQNCWWARKGQELEKAFENNNFAELHRFWRELQRPRGGIRISAVYGEGQKPGDSPLTEAEEVRARFGRHFEAILNLPSEAVEGVTDGILQEEVEEWMGRAPSRAEVR